MTGLRNFSPLAPSGTCRPAARPAVDGEALAPALRQRYEPLFGADFSAVRVHADARSDAATRAVDADAFTAGSHLHFAAGRWRPDSEAGQRLLGHELAHVLQQGAARGSASARPGEGARALESEADRAADAAVAVRRTPVAMRPDAPALQRKPRSFDPQFDTGHWDVIQNPKAFKALYVQWRADLTDTITAHCGPVETAHDYRFVLMLAQRMVEQDGPHAKAEGNNPYNVMGQGDKGQFFRKKNEEGPAGAKEKRPAWFAAFSGEGMANDAYLDMLKQRWPNAFDAIATGASTKTFVQGLYPGYPNNYATAAKADYVSGVRRRARGVVGDLRLVYTSYLNDYRARLKANPPASPAPAVAGDAELNQIAVALLEQELKELDDLTDRIIAEQPVNRPPVVGAAP